MTPSLILMIPCGANDAILVGMRMIMIDDGDADGDGDGDGDDDDN